MIGLLRLGFDEGISADELAVALRRHAGDVAGEDVDQLAGVLEGYLRTVPDALGAALGMSKDPHCGRAVAFQFGRTLTDILVVPVRPGERMGPVRCAVWGNPVPGGGILQRATIRRSPSEARSLSTPASMAAAMCKRYAVRKPQ